MMREWHRRAPWSSSTKKLLLFVFLVGSSLEGCSKKAGSDKPPEKKEEKKADTKKEDKKPAVDEKVEANPRAFIWLTKIGLAYHKCISSTKKPPAKAEDLAPYYENDAAIFPENDKITDALRKGQIVFIYNSSIQNMPAGTEKTILAYEKEVPTSGGLALMADGMVRPVTADQFKKAPKAAGK
jgi:hypothetical protein